MTSIKLAYEVIDDNQYQITNKAGIRFGARFNITFFDSAGIMVIPIDLLENYDGIVEYFLAKGCYDQNSNPNSKLINIPAINYQLEETTIFFAGVISDYPADRYDEILVAVCYYQHQGQIYFSSEELTSFEDEAKYYLTDPTLLNSEQIAVLQMIAQGGGK